MPKYDGEMGIFEDYEGMDSEINTRPVSADIVERWRHTAPCKVLEHLWERISPTSLQCEHCGAVMFYANDNPADEITRLRGLLDQATKALESAKSSLNCYTSQGGLFGEMSLKKIDATLTRIRGEKRDD